MLVQPPWTLDIETIVGVAITLLAVLVVPVATRLRARWRKRSNRHDRRVRSLRLVGGPYWKDAAVDDRNGGAVGIHGQERVSPEEARSIKKRLPVLIDDFRAPLKQNPADAPADE